MAKIAMVLVLAVLVAGGVVGHAAAQQVGTVLTRLVPGMQRTTWHHHTGQRSGWAAEKRRTA